MSEELLLNTFKDIHNRLSRLSARFLKNEDDVNDTLQEAFCRLWPRRGLIGSREEAEALSVTTVRNLSIWKSHATLTLLAKQDLPTFGYNMIDPLKSWCWGAVLFYPFKISRFS